MGNIDEANDNYIAIPNNRQDDDTLLESRRHRYGGNKFAVLEN